MKSAVPPVHNHRAKLQRAYHHLQELQGRISHDHKAGSFGAIPQFDPEQGKHQIAFAIPVELRITYGLIVGDCVQNLRSALDHLVYAMSSPKHRDRSQFPIFWDIQEYVDKGLPMIAGIPTDAQTVIERLQPYHAGRDARAEPLAMLARLSNWDKHRLVAVTEFELAGDRFVPTGHDLTDFSGITEGYSSTGPLIDQTPIRALPSDVQQMHYQYAISVTFGESAGPAQGQRVVPVLTNLGNTVESIIETLEPFLPPR